MFLLNCNYDTKHLSTIPTFYLEMLKFASYILVPIHGEEIIWNNKNILIDNKPLFWKRWIDSGIILIRDLLNEEGKWLSSDRFRLKFKFDVPFLEYLGLINAIKASAANERYFKYNDRNERPANINFHSTIFRLVNGHKIDLKKAKCKDYYNVFISNNNEPPIAMARWEILGVDNDTFYNSFMNAKLATKNPQLLSTHFKIINNF